MDRLRSALAATYTIEEELGRGGMAVVYAARDLRHGRRVAIKLLSREETATRNAERFQQEIRLAAGLVHPHILPVFDSGEVAGQLYYVMPLVEGESLRARLRREGRLPLADALRLARELAEGLDCAHRAGIIHRDVKPENILLAHGHAVLADFGIAREGAAGSGQGLTVAGTFVGTPEYMSPEVLLGEAPPGPWSDLYALGCVVFEMLTGRPPHGGSGAQGILAQRLTRGAPRVRELRPELSPSLEAELARALAPAPNDRHPTMGEFARALAGGTSGVADAPTDISLVVQPFVGAGSGELADFADGLTDEVIVALTKIRALRVISRASAVRLKETTLSVREIGREFAVRYLVTGSVRHSGSRVRVSAEVVDTVLDAAVWSDRFDGSVEDPFALQEAVARGIAAALNVQLTPADEARLQTHPVADPRAADWIRRATLDVLSFTRDGIERAEALAAKAEEVVGSNAAVCILRAMIEFQWVNAGFDVNDATRSAAHLGASLRWVDRAESLGGQSSDVAFVRSWIFYSTGRTADAVREAMRSLDADPNHVLSLTSLVTIMWANGLLDDATRVSDRLLRIDPFDAWGTVARGWCLAQRGEVAERERWLERAVSLAPSGLMRFVAGLACGAVGDMPAATRWWNLTVAYDDDSLGYKLGKAAVAALSGDGAPARLLATEQAAHPTLSLDPQWALHTAQVQSLAGDADGALATLRRATACGLAYMEGLREQDPMLRAARHHPGFPEVLARAEANHRAIVAAL